MKKIPTLFVRNPEDRRHVIVGEVTPGCEWVLADEGMPTVKWDGTCVLILRDGLNVKGFARREVKPGKEPPANWREVDHDEVAGKRAGWEPIAQSGFAKFFDEALAAAVEEGDPLTPGTYELCGPKINGNPEDFDRHQLVRHGSGFEVELTPTTVEGIVAAVGVLGEMGIEGIVWHHPDGRMAKLKARDIPGNA